MVFITVAQLFLIFWVVIYLTINMIYLVRLYPAKERSILYPYLSVCIPARNEERDIKNCLESLLNQDYPAFEVIVVDDNSSDTTASIISSMKSQYSNLVLISGKSLAPGWLGKPYALYQACQVSRGDYLLFTDADLVYQRYASKTAMNKVIDEKIDLLTLMPASIFGSFWERAIQPVIFGFIAALTNFRKVNSPASQIAMGFGAFLLFKKEAYLKIGGHISVQNEILEDVMIAKISKRNGLNMLVADGKLLFSIRMYHSIKEIWVGWRKNIFLAMKGSIIRTIFYVVMILCFVVTPYIIVIVNFLVGGVAWICISLIGLILCLITGCGLCHELGLKKHNVFLFPLGAIAMVVIMFNSMVQVVFFGRAEWRGRIYKQ